MSTRKGFTLLELLVVLSIIALLLGIALPQYRAVQTRAQVATASCHLRQVETGLEWFRSDHLRYPQTQAGIPGDPLGLLSSRQLSVLTTPIAYASPGALTDPFGVIEAQFQDPTLAAGNDFPQLAQPNTERSLLYFDYPSLAVRLRSPAVELQGSAVLSIGPDRKDSLGVYRPFGQDFFDVHLHNPTYSSPLDTVYSPTNGTHSSGDIGAYVGEARRFRVP